MNYHDAISAVLEQNKEKIGKIVTNHYRNQIDGISSYDNTTDLIIIYNNGGFTTVDPSIITSIYIDSNALLTQNPETSEELLSTLEVEYEENRNPFTLFFQASGKDELVIKFK